MGDIMDFNPPSSGQTKFPKSDPVDNILNQPIVIVDVAFDMTTRGNEIARITTDKGAVYRTQSKILLRDLKEGILPNIEKGHKIRVKIVKKTFNNGNRGYVFESP